MTSPTYNLEVSPITFLKRVNSRNRNGNENSDKEHQKPRKQIIPPILLWKKEQWSHLLQLIWQRNIHIKECKNKGLEIKIWLAELIISTSWTKEDSNTKLINSEKYGAQKHIDINHKKEIEETPKKQRFQLVIITRWWNYVKVRIQLVVHTSTERPKHIYDIKQVCSLRVRAETLNRKTNEGQWGFSTFAKQ